MKTKASIRKELLKIKKIYNIKCKKKQQNTPKTKQNKTKKTTRSWLIENLIKLINFYQDLSKRNKKEPSKWNHK